jgi:hypothetical protein
MIIFQWFFLVWEMCQTNFVEKIKTLLLCSITFFRKLCRLRDNVEKPGRDRQTTGDNTIRLMTIACWITKAADKHWEYVILITFLWKLWLRERATILRYTCIACLVTFPILSVCNRLLVFTFCLGPSSHVINIICVISLIIIFIWISTKLLLIKRIDFLDT